MGCPCEFRFYADRKPVFDAAVRKCLREVRRFDKKYSRYLPKSVTSLINVAAGRCAVAIDNETASILRYSEVCYEQSDRLFDITSGVFRKIWHRQRTTLPSERELVFWLAKVGWSKVEYSETQVYLPLAGMELDFGGVVKEYAADAAAMVARQAGIRHGLVNLGGDICIVGARPDGEPWSIGIVHPLLADSAIASVSLAAGALATSGSYERYVEVGGRRYSHLINPRSGWPVDGLLSVSVAAGQTVVAGSIASSALLRTPADGLKWLERSGAPYLAVDSELNCHGQLGDG